MTLLETVQESCEKILQDPDQGKVYARLLKERERYSDKLICLERARRERMEERGETVLPRSPEIRELRAVIGYIGQLMGQYRSVAPAR